MQRLKIKNQIQFTHVLKKSVQGLNKHLNQIEQSERRFRRSRYQNKIQGGVMPICDQRWGVIVGCGNRILLTGRTGEQGRKPSEVERKLGRTVGIWGWKRGDTCGRKLQAEDGRWETRVNISEINRCWTLVSCEVAIRKYVIAKTLENYWRAACRIWWGGVGPSCWKQEQHWSWCLIRNMRRRDVCDFALDPAYLPK